MTALMQSITTVLRSLMHILRQAVACMDFMPEITPITLINHSQSLDGAERVLCLDRLEEFDPLPSVGTLN